MSGSRPVFRATDWIGFHPEFYAGDNYDLLEMCDKEIIERDGTKYCAMVGISQIGCFGKSSIVGSREDAVRDAVIDLRKTIEIRTHFESPESVAESRMAWDEVFRDRGPEIISASN